jgi:hypothetical protein
VPLIRAHPKPLSEYAAQVVHTNCLAFHQGFVNRIVYKLFPECLILYLNLHVFANRHKTDLKVSAGEINISCGLIQSSWHVAMDSHTSFVVHGMGVTWVCMAQMCAR